MGEPEGQFPCFAPKSEPIGLLGGAMLRTAHFSSKGTSELLCPSMPFALVKRCVPAPRDKEYRNKSSDVNGRMKVFFRRQFAFEMSWELRRYIHAAREGLRIKGNAQFRKI